MSNFIGLYRTQPALYIVISEDGKMANDTKFSHRHNSDGSIDSICRECYVTVARAQNESALYREERAHACDPRVIAWYHEPQRTEPEDGVRASRP